MDSLEAATAVIKRHSDFQNTFNTGGGGGGATIHEQKALQCMNLPYTWPDPCLFDVSKINVYWQQLSSGSQAKILHIT